MNRLPLAIALLTSVLSGSVAVAQQFFTDGSSIVEETNVMRARFYVALNGVYARKCRLPADDALIAEAEAFYRDASGGSEVLRTTLGTEGYKPIIGALNSVLSLIRWAKVYAPCQTPAVEQPTLSPGEVFVPRAAPPPPPPSTPVAIRRAEGPSFAPLSIYVGADFGVSTSNAHFNWMPNPAGFGPIDTILLNQFANRTLQTFRPIFGGGVGIEIRGDDIIVSAAMPGMSRSGDEIVVGAGSGGEPRIRLFGGLTADVHSGGVSLNRLGLFTSAAGGLFPVQENAEIDIDAALRVRAGVSLSGPNGISMNPYVTAGIAGARVAVNGGIAFSPTAFNFGQTSQMMLGPAVGGGALVDFGGGWRVNLLYLHEQFGTIRTVLPSTVAPTAFIEATHRVRNDRVTVGLEKSLDFATSDGYLVR